METHTRFSLAVGLLIGLSLGLLVNAWLGLALAAFFGMTHLASCLVARVGEPGNADDLDWLDRQESPAGPTTAH